MRDLWSASRDTGSWVRRDQVRRGVPGRRARSEGHKAAASERWSDGRKVRRWGGGAGVVTAQAPAACQRSPRSSILPTRERADDEDLRTKWVADRTQPDWLIHQFV